MVDFLNTELPPGGGPARLNWDELRDRLHFDLLATPQREYAAIAAVNAAQAACGELAKLGYLFELIEFQAAPIEEWPKAVYHPELGTRTINSQAEFDRLGAGWSHNQFWPKTFSHAEMGTRTVSDNAAAQRLGPGWTEARSLPQGPNGRRDGGASAVGNAEAEAKAVSDNAAAQRVGNAAGPGVNKVL